ncbi:two-component sensor histidine kinase [Streptomyces camponoticapitis]|uniref:histidine kinase n=1 Tax=Streptomyces camponoticapitis TaxID=1616125 RepID=A0ABQ2ERX8_9ACTN|nr:histidine kinase [Streptomyces camponoticapitis]GGK22890.1 two-component sensor histidine kinase [Streptomyces camponoticapitis]
MTNTQTKTAKTATGKARSPEFRAVAGLIGSLRQDLFHDAFAYRPLPRMATDGVITRRLPERLREYAGWFPHSVIVGCSLFALLVGTANGSGLDLITVVPLLLVLIRPVAAWWLALAVTAITGMSTSYYADWPWTPSAFASYLAVMTIVAIRTNPRTAGWMWLLTLGYSIVVETLFGGGYMYSSTTAPMLFVSALTLLAVSALHIRRDAKKEVAVQLSVNAVERSRRTLLEERTTIARELHDVVAHHMSVVAIQAEAAPYRVENPPPELEKAFATIRENAVAALTELRRVLGVVRAEDYDAPDAPQPTLADLEGLLSNVREAGLTVEKAVTGAVRELPQGVELSAYRIIQEALSNALRHAPGATAKVEVSYVLGGLGLRIVNTPPQGLVKPSPGAGHGITGMRERVTMLNGEMTARLLPDGGYEVAAYIPVAVQDEDEPADAGAGPATKADGERS